MASHVSGSSGSSEDYGFHILNLSEDQTLTPAAIVEQQTPIMLGFVKELLKLKYDHAAIVRKLQEFYSEQVRKTSEENNLTQSYLEAEGEILKLQLEESRSSKIKADFKLVMAQIRERNFLLQLNDQHAQLQNLHNQQMQLVNAQNAAAQTQANFQLVMAQIRERNFLLQLNDQHAQLQNLHNQQMQLVNAQNAAAQTQANFQLVMAQIRERNLTQQLNAAEIAKNAAYTSIQGLATANLNALQQRNAANQARDAAVQQLQAANAQHAAATQQINDQLALVIQQRDAANQAVIAVTQQRDGANQARAAAVAEKNAALANRDNAIQSRNQALCKFRAMETVEMASKSLQLFRDIIETLHKNSRSLSLEITDLQSSRNGLRSLDQDIVHLKSQAQQTDSINLVGLTNNLVDMVRAEGINKLRFWDQIEERYVPNIQRQLDALPSVLINTHLSLEARKNVGIQDLYRHKNAYWSHPSEYWKDCVLKTIEEQKKVKALTKAKAELDALRERVNQYRLSPINHHINNR